MLVIRFKKEARFLTVSHTLQFSYLDDVMARSATSYENIEVSRQHVDVYNNYEKIMKNILIRFKKNLTLKRILLIGLSVFKYKVQARKKVSERTRS